MLLENKLKIRSLEISPHKPQTCPKHNSYDLIRNASQKVSLFLTTLSYCQGNQKYLFTFLPFDTSKWVCAKKLRFISTCWVMKECSLFYARNRNILGLREKNFLWCCHVVTQILRKLRILSKTLFLFSFFGKKIVIMEN